MPMEAMEVETLVQKAYPKSQCAQDHLRQALELLLPSVSARRAVPESRVEAVVGDRLCKLSADNDSATIEVVPIDRETATVTLRPVERPRAGFHDMAEGELRGTEWSFQLGDGASVPPVYGTVVVAKGAAISCDHDEQFARALAGLLGFKLCELEDMQDR